MAVRRKNNLKTSRVRIPERSPGKTPAREGKINLSTLVVLSAIVIYTAILYSRSINNGFNWDDKKYLLTNNYILNFSWNGIKDIFKVSSSILGTYQPVTNLSWMIECKFWGLSPDIFHRTNLIFHLMNLVLVFIFINMLTGNRAISALTAFFFAIHPLHVESVAWNSERKDVIYAFFFLLSLISYLKYIKSGLKIKYILLSFLFFNLSLLSKSMAVTLPFILPVIDHYSGRKIFTKKNMAEKAPFLVISVIFIILTLKTQDQGILNLTVTYSYFNRFFLITYGLSYYILEFFSPYHLSAIHPYPEIKNNILPLEYYLSFLFLALIIYIIIRYGSKRKYIISGCLFFVLTIFPVIQVIPFGLAIVSERYSYIPYLGFFIIILSLADEAEFFKKAGKFYWYAILVIFTTYFSFSTWNRILVWKNPVTLWSDNVSKNPGYFLAYYKLGGAYESEKNYSKQVECYTSCISLNPSFSNAYNDRGLTRCMMGDIRGGIEDYNMAIKIDPLYSEAYNNRGMARDNTGDINGAIDDFNRSVNLNPGYYEAYNNRGWVYYNMNKTEEAILDYKMAIYLNNNFLTAFENLGWVYYNLKNYDESINYYSSAIKISAGDARSYQFRGLSYFYTNRLDEACNDWQRAKEYGRTDAGELIAKYCK